MDLILYKEKYLELQFTYMTNIEHVKVYTKNPPRSNQSKIEKIFQLCEENKITNDREHSMLS